MRQLIVTADDFGASRAVNQAVELAHRGGVLRCASLMVGGAAAAEAVERARRLPSLRVGLHVVVVDGRPQLPAAQVPDLVNKHGEFDNRLFLAGMRFFFLPRVRRQLDAEIRAQFLAFAATGLPLDHVNAHKHMHLHPTVLGTILRVGREYGMRAMRLPYEPRQVMRQVAAGEKRRRAALAALLLTPWLRLLRRRLRRADLRFNEYVFGLSTTGAMDEDTLLRILAALPSGLSEVYLHPGASPPRQPGQPAATQQEPELHSLTSPRVLAALQAAAIRTVSFSEIR